MKRDMIQKAATHTHTHTHRLSSSGLMKDLRETDREEHGSGAPHFVVPTSGVLMSKGTSLSLDHENATNYYCFARNVLVGFATLLSRLSIASS